MTTVLDQLEAALGVVPDHFPQLQFVRITEGSHSYTQVGLFHRDTLRALCEVARVASLDIHQCSICGERPTLHAEDCALAPLLAPVERDDD